MEMIKDIVKQLYPLIIMLICVLFVTGVFFSETFLEKKGVFQGSGRLFEPVLEEKIKNDGLHYLDVVVSTYVPVVKYVASAQTTGSSIRFKEQFEVTKEDGSVVKGSVEDEFAIYLLDIKNMAGESVLLRMTEDEIAREEEIPASFVYEAEEDILYCFENGIYTASIKVYGANGGQKTYEFMLPVDRN